MALGAYQAETTRGNVLNAIAHPNVVNPMSGIGDAVTAARGIMDLRTAQANQAIGGILQQATDPDTGQVDYGQAQKLAATAGPVVQAGMQSMLLNNAQLRGQQINQSAALYSQVGRSAATVMNDPSDANVNMAVDGLVRQFPGQQQQFEAEREAILAMKDPQQRRTYAYQHLLSTMDARDQMGRSPYGDTSLQNFGGYQGPYTTYQGSPYGQGGGAQGPGAVTTTAGPSITSQIVTFPADQAYVQKHPGVALNAPVNRPYGQVMQEMGAGWMLPPGASFSGGGSAGGGGVRNQDGSPVGSSNPPRLLNVPGGGGNQGGANGGAASTPPPASNAAPAASSVPPPPPGGSGAGYTGGGIGAALAPGGAGGSAPAASAPPAASPPVTDPVAAAKVQAARTGQAVPIPGSQGLVAFPNGNVGPSRVAPSFGPPAAAAPAGVNTSRDTMTPGPRADLGGPQIASATPYAPASVGLAAPPSPAVQGDVGAILGGMAQARGAPATGTQTAGDVVMGPGSQEVEENKRSGELLTAHDTAAANYQQTAFPYTQALSLYGRGMTTGPTTDQVNAIKGWANAAARSLGASQPFDSTQEYDSLHKYLSQIVSGNPVAAGSDARLAEVLAGNANTSIHELAGADMIKAGIALQRMTVALDNGWHNLSPQAQAQYGGSYMNYLRAQAPTIDVRAFARDLYNPEQIKTLNTDLQNGSQQDRQNFLDTLALARNGRLIRPSGQPAAMP